MMFITFEGIDGCGKSTQAKRLYDVLRCRREVVLTKEPGGWKGGEALRELVISSSLQNQWSEIFLFMLDRAEHASRIIIPSLAEGRDLLCERYHDSTIAYQAFGRGMPIEPICEMASLLSFPTPDITVLFDILPEFALSRVFHRGRPDVFESEGFAFMKRVREGYLSLAHDDPKRWLIIECGERTEDEIFSELKCRLSERGLSL